MAEDVPDIVTPDDNAGNKRWRLQNRYLYMAPEADPDIAVDGQMSYDTGRWRRLYD